MCRQKSHHYRLTVFWISNSEAKRRLIVKEFFSMGSIQRSAL